jgi:hypothetical protein
MPIIQIRTIWVPPLCHVEWCRKKREPTLTPPVFLRGVNKDHIGSGFGVGMSPPQRLFGVRDRRSRLPCARPPTGRIRGLQRAPPRSCLEILRSELVVAEDTAFASINGVPKSGASALSLGVDYRRHQLVYKFDRKQIGARHGPLVLVPIRRSNAHPPTSGTLDEAVAIPTDSCGRRSVSVIRPSKIRDLGRSCVSTPAAAIRPPEKGRQNLPPNRPTRSPPNYRFTKGYPCQAATSQNPPSTFPRA